MRVLIADDQKDVGRALADLVRCCNHEIVGVVGSGLEAINAYSLLHPDLVLMDYRMPKLNGGTACRHIIAKDPAARIILVSAWSPLDGADKSGAISFLPKPVDFERLNATLQSIAETLPVPVPAENINSWSSNASAARTSDPIAEVVFYQPDSIDYFQPVVEPLPIALPFSETSFPADAPQNDFQQTAEPCALEKQKISSKGRSTRRRASRARAR